MFQPETHLMLANRGGLQLWCNRCGCHIAHDLIVTTDNEVTRTMADTYRDENRITRIQAECWDGHKQTIL